MKSTNSALKLYFYGVTICVNTSEEQAEMQDVLARLNKDFLYFTKKIPTRFLVSIDLRLELSNQSGGLPFMNHSRIWGLWKKRTCYYPDGSRVKFTQQKHKRESLIEARDPQRIYDLCYMFILSSVGEVLEAWGLHRLHALSYQYKKQGRVFLLPSGGGKSSLAVKLLKETDVTLFSDEIALTDGQSLFPFPVPIALAADVVKKFTFDIPVVELHSRHVGLQKKTYAIPKDKIASPSPWTHLDEGIPSPSLSVQPSDRFISLGFKVVFGYGLPQMGEYLIRLDNIFILMRVAAQRLKLVFKLKKMKGISQIYFPSNPDSYTDFISFLKNQK